MTTNTKDKANTSQQIKAQEDELKELLNRVIKSPLQPLETQIAQLQIRMQNVEDISEKIAKNSFPEMHAAIREQGEEVRKIIKGFRATITDELPEMLTACLASMPQEMTKLLEVQTSVKDILSEVQKEQNLLSKLAGDASLQSETLLLKSLSQMDEINDLAKTAVQASEKAVTQIDESRAHIGKNLDIMQADGRLGMQHLGNEMTTLAGSLSRTNAQVESLATMPQEMAQLVEGQTSVKDILSEVQKEQTLQGKRAGDATLQSESLLLKSLTQMDEINNLAKATAQASNKAVVQIDESREHIEKNLDGMQAEGRVGIQKIGDEMTVLMGSLNRTSAQVTDLAPTLSRQTDELSSRLESAFSSFRGQSEKDRTELSNSLQVMQKRFLWVSVLCGLSFAGSFGLIMSRFIL